MAGQNVTSGIDDKQEANHGNYPQRNPTLDERAGWWFTGDVRIDSPFQRSEPSRLTGAIVTFEPGARAPLAHPSARTDADRDVGDRLDSMQANPASRSMLVT